ncbi:MAG TPA: NAD-dependent epimerase/dehydratase family protein [Gemmatimonadales bacterium]|nr:NAD-dependent epimerase/dehydratase family protein [Gemmatimonadales bacterium]
MTAKWVVTGAAGFIGSHVCDRLVGRGDEVIGIDNFDPFYARDIKERNLAGVQGSKTFRLLDLDCATTDLPWSGVQGVVHLAAKAGVRPSLDDPVAYVEANVRATARLLDGARRAGVKRMVLASSSSVYGNDTPAPFKEDATADAPISPYAASKRGAELMARAFAHLYGMRIACVRYFTVYGPRQRPDLAIHRFTRAIARDETIRMFGDGSAERDYTFISDGVDGTLAALDWTGRSTGADRGEARVFNIGGGERVRLDRLIDLIGRALKRSPRIERAPMQAGDVELTSADLSRSAAELGYRPRVGIEEGIREFVTWYEGAYGRQS